MQYLKKIDSAVARLEGYALVFLLAVMIALSFCQVLLRNFFQQGFLWADILLRQLTLWVGFLGASLAVRGNRHISIDILQNLLPASWKPRLLRTAQLIAGIISSVLAISAFKFVSFEKEGGSTLFLNLPGWWFQTILPFSFSLIALRFILKALDGSAATPTHENDGENQACFFP